MESKTSAKALDFGEDFLTHSGSASGSSFLKGWKKDGIVTIWMHPRAPVYSLWGHSWHEVGKEEDDQKREVEVIKTVRSNCFEDEKVLKKQQWRGRDGKREVPPLVCPHCIAVEWVRDQIDAGKLEWSTPVFKFVSDDPLGGEELIIHAGGFTGLFGKSRLSREEEAQLRKADVKQSESYLEKGYPRMQYVMAVANASDLDVGWVIAIESQTLGDKMKREIAAEIKRCGGGQEGFERGHPKNNPYPFEWTYDENKDFSNKYDVTALTRTAPGPEVQKLLEQEPPSFEKLIELPNLRWLYDGMKAAMQVDMPLDSFFEKAVEQYGMPDSTEAGGDKPAAAGRAPEVSSKPSAGADEEEKIKIEETIECDHCSGPMGESDTTCSHCGAKYGQDKEGAFFMASRPCGNEDCMEKEVPVTEYGTGTCPQCGAVHEEDWKFQLPPKRQRTARTSRRRSKAS